MIDLIRLLLDNGAVKFGDFTLPYGNKMDYFVDVKEVSTDPKFLDEISTELCKKVNAKKIAGVELGAVPLLVVTATKLKIPFVVIRKEYKHGTKEMLVGKIKDGERIDIIEDVVSTGGSILHAVKTLRDKGAIVSRAITVVDRQEGGAKLLADNGVELISLLNASELRKHKNEEI